MAIGCDVPIAEWPVAACGFVSLLGLFRRGVFWSHLGTCVALEYLKYFGCVNLVQWAFVAVISHKDGG